ncbi:MAG: hypothetical protein WBF75_17290 [Pseudonocardiaceae bacterium]
MTTAERLVVELAGKIPAAWAGVVSAVDRARFIPARVWVDDEDNELRPAIPGRRPAVVVGSGLLRYGDHDSVR